MKISIRDERRAIAGDVGWDPKIVIEFDPSEIQAIRDGLVLANIRDEQSLFRAEEFLTQTYHALLRLKRTP